MAEETPLTFPKAADKDRLGSYEYYDKLYEGEHYEAFKIKGEKDFDQRYNKLRYIVANFAGLLSKVLADMLFGEKLTVDVEKNQEFIDNLIEENHFITQLYESALVNSRRGDVVFRLRVGKRNVNNMRADSTIIIEQESAGIYFPEFDDANAKNTPAVDYLIWKFKLNGVTYLHKEGNRPGYITHEIFKYDEKDEKIISVENPLDFNYQPIEETGVDRSLVFHIPNYRDGKGYFGPSDYKDLVTLFFALNNRITKVDNILDKHSDPILAVPPGVIDEDGKVRKEALGMFEVDNDNSGFNKPEYIVWNANLESAVQEIDRLIDLLFMFSEVAPATMGKDKDGRAESGRALKFKLITTIRKRNRKIQYYDQAIKDILQTAQELAIANGIKVGGVSISEVERPKIDWGDGIINDETEMVDNSVKRLDAGLSSRSGEISKLDGLTPDEAKKKVEEIDQENSVDVPVIGNQNQV